MRHGALHFAVLMVDMFKRSLSSRNVPFVSNAAAATAAATPAVASAAVLRANPDSGTGFYWW